MYRKIEFLRLPTGCITGQIYQFTFEAAEEIFRHRIVVRLALPGHTLHKAQFFELFSVRRCRILHAPIRMKHPDFFRMSMTSSFCASCLRKDLISASRSRWRRSMRFAELGYDTVLISQYGGCSETCEPWQGRAYIDDVFTIWNGEINGDSGKSQYCGKWFPLLSSAIRGGLFHPNCRHTMGLYIDGVTKIPPPIPAEQIRKQRELEQKQRVMERKIRKLKRLEAGTQDPQAVKEYGRKARAAQQELKAFVDEHRDVLKRDYEREKYYGSGVDKSGGSGIIIKEQSKEPITEITDKAIESVPKIKIDGYTDEQCELIQQHHKELLKYSRDNNDSKEVAFVMDSSMSSRKEFVGSDDKLDFGSELYGKDLFVMHNHPRSSSYSITDLIFFRNNTNVKTLTIIKNSGGVEFITKTSEFDGNKYKLEYDRLYKKIVLTGTESEKDKFVRTFLRKTKSGVIWNERQK